MSAGEGDGPGRVGQQGAVLEVIEGIVRGRQPARRPCLARRAMLGSTVDAARVPVRPVMRTTA